MGLCVSCCTFGTQSLLQQNLLNNFNILHLWFIRFALTALNTNESTFSGYDGQSRDYVNDL